MYKPKGYQGYPVEGIHMEEKIYRGKPHLIVRAETPYDWIEFTDSVGYVSREKGNFLYGTAHNYKQSGTYASEDDGFYGTTSFKQWAKLLTEGWEKGAKSAGELADELVPYLFGTKVVDQEFNDYEGDEVDVDRYLQNDPECMINYKETKVNGGAKFLKIGINLSVNASVSSNALIWRGILVAALVDTLETHGYRLDVYGYDYTRGRQGDRLTIIPVKNENQPCDLERLASLIGHPSSLRRGVFSADEKLHKSLFAYYVSGGYGGAISSYPVDSFPCDIYVGDDCLCHSAEDAAVRFKEKLQELPDFYEMIQDQAENPDDIYY
jgi:hypothetical protein